MKSICLLLLVLLGLSGCRKNSSLQTPTILQIIPENDCQLLDSFFQFLLRDHAFAYTWFGNKPMSMFCYPLQTTSFALYHPIEHLILEKGWKTWEHYCVYFPSDHFVLKRCNLEDRPGLGIFLIHKKNTLRIIKDHLDTFQNMLGYPIEPEWLLEQLCNPEQSIEATLKGHAGLLGILLGYGKMNALYFDRKANICEYFNAKMTPPFSGHHEMKSLSPTSRNLVRLYSRTIYPYPSKSLLPSSEYSSLADELNEILSQESYFEPNDWFLSKISAPIFVSRKGSLETKKLQDEYVVTMRRLCQVYQRGSFLEVTLNQWMYPQ